MAKPWRAENVGAILDEHERIARKERLSSQACSSCGLTFAQSDLLHAVKVGDALLKAEIMQCVEGAIRMYEKGTCASTASMVTADAIVGLLEQWK
jgi:hypothetical protein